MNGIKNGIYFYLLHLINVNVISDLGQSIPTSIPTKITDGMLKRVFNFTSWGDIDDAEKIEIATQYQRTSTQLAYRGKGFQDMKAVCDQIDGAIMAVHSKCGYWAKQTKNGSERFKKQKLQIIYQWYNYLMASAFG